jgi:hypothetical protein
VGAEGLGLAFGFSPDSAATTGTGARTGSGCGDGVSVVATFTPRSEIKKIEHNWIE